MTFTIIIQIILIGIGLAMDAAAVSMANGLTEPKMPVKKILIIALFFGVFQGFMPLIGYLLGSTIAAIISRIAPWAALILLSFIGGKMIYEGFKKSDNENVSLTMKTLFLQAIATSIDALAVGIVFVGNPFKHVIIYSGIIAFITFSLSIASLYIGKKFGVILSKWAQIVGGSILIGIGLKIFIEYLIG